MTNRIKVVLAAPGDQDPPQHPLYTQDNMIGINPPDFETPELPTPYDYGAKGDGVTDDTVAVQAWLDAIARGVGYGKAGVFILSSPVYIDGNTTIWGAGADSFVLKTKQGVSQDFFMFGNKHFVNFPDSPTDLNIAIYGTQFCGDPSLRDSPQDFVDFIGVSGLTIRDCLFTHRRRALLTISNCYNVVIDANEFTDWGDNTFSGIPLSWFGGNAIFCYTKNFNVRITNNNIHNGEGQGIWLNGDGSVNFLVDHNIVAFCEETGITGAPSQCIISNNSILSVGLIDVSGNGMELQGTDIQVIGNTVENCAKNCINIANPKRVVIANNNFYLPNQSSTGGNCLTVASNTKAAVGFDPPAEQVTITDNNFGTPYPKLSQAIVFSNFVTPYTDGMMNEILTQSNNFGDPSGWISAHAPDTVVPAIGYFDQGATTPAVNGVQGSNFVTKNNLGSTDNVPAIYATTHAASTGSWVISALPFRPRYIKITAFVGSAASAATQQVSFGEVNLQNDGSIGQFAMTMASDATGPTFYTNADYSNCIFITDAASTALFKASCTDVSGTGFALNITVASVAINIHVVAMP